MAQQVVSSIALDHLCAKEKHASSSRLVIIALLPLLFHELLREMHVPLGLCTYVSAAGCLSPTSLSPFKYFSQCITSNVFPREDDDVAVLPKFSRFGR